MSNAMHSLAQSVQFEVLHEFEDAWLVRRGLPTRTAIGDFYGDPHCAIIDSGEKWCVGGQGLVVYFLEEPFHAYRHGQPSPQYVELGRGQHDGWWVESIRQTGPAEVHIVLESGAQQYVAFPRSADGLVAVSIR